MTDDSAHRRPPSRDRGFTNGSWRRTARSPSRSVAVGSYLLGLAILALGLRLRPPLTPDLLILSLPLGAFPGSPLPSAELLRGDGGIAMLGIGGLFGALAVVGAVYLLLAPKRLDRAFGALLVSSIALTAAAAINHPTLIEELDLQLRERGQIASFIRENEPDSVTMSGTGRIRADVGPTEDFGDLSEGFVYLAHAGWLVGLVVIVFVSLCAGATRIRLARLAVVLALAVLLSGILGGRRLLGEYHWSEAKRSERAGDFVQAARSIESALRIFPEFGYLQRTWLLWGKIDHLQGIATPRDRFYRANQAAAAGQTAEAVTLAELQLGGPEAESFAARNQMAWILETLGLDLQKQKNFVAARREFGRSIDVADARWASRIYAGIVDASAFRSPPEAVQSLLEPAIDRWVDRTIDADISSTLGDTCFDAGRMARARSYYRDSIRAFELPKQINYRARQGLVGM